MKNYQKSKSKLIKGKNAAGPKFRTSSNFRSNFIAGKKPMTPQIKFNPGQFKIQHKG